MADKYLNKTVLNYFYNRLKTVFADKSEIPTLTSELTNDGDGDSLFATETYVQENGGKIDTISVNNSPQTITNKNVNITIPTNLSELTNDSGFQTQSQVQSLIEGELADITSIDYQVVNALPSTGQKGVIYLVSKDGSNNDVYDEYIYINNSFEKIGTTAVDLSNYWSKSELTAITTAEIDEIIGA